MLLLVEDGFGIERIEDSYCWEKEEWSFWLLLISCNESLLLSSYRSSLLPKLATTDLCSSPSERCGFRPPLPVCSCRLAQEIVWENRGVNFRTHPVHAQQMWANIWRGRRLVPSLWSPEHMTGTFSWTDWIFLFLIIKVYSWAIKLSVPGVMNLQNQ